jgi:hypothetical protein
MVKPLRDPPDAAAATRPPSANRGTPRWLPSEKPLIASRNPTPTRWTARALTINSPLLIRAHPFPSRAQMLSLVPVPEPRTRPPPANCSGGIGTDPGDDQRLAAELGAKDRIEQLRNRVERCGQRAEPREQHLEGEPRAGGEGCETGDQIPEPDGLNLLAATAADQHHQVVYRRHRVGDDRLHPGADRGLVVADRRRQRVHDRDKYLTDHFADNLARFFDDKKQRFVATEKFLRLLALPFEDFRVGEPKPLNRSFRLFEPLMEIDKCRELVFPTLAECFLRDRGLDRRVAHRFQALPEFLGKPDVALHVVGEVAEIDPQGREWRRKIGGRARAAAHDRHALGGCRHHGTQRAGGGGRGVRQAPYHLDTARHFTGELGDLLAGLADHRDKFPEALNEFLGVGAGFSRNQGQGIEFLHRKAERFGQVIHIVGCLGRFLGELKNPDRRRADTDRRYCLEIRQDVVGDMRKTVAEFRHGIAQPADRRADRRARPGMRRSPG